MSIRTLAGALALLAAVSTVSAEKFVRYNQIGYAPSAIKRIVVMAEEDCLGLPWAVKDSAGSTIYSGTLGKSLCGKGPHTNFPFNYEFRFDSLRTEGQYTISVADIPSFTVTVKKDPYKFVLEKVLRWMRVARSGSKDVLDREASHFGDTSCLVSHRFKGDNKVWIVDTLNPKKVNMAGGWYDAGDYLKFTLTIAYANYFMLRSYETYPEIFHKTYSKTEYIDILDESKFGLDWLMKTMPDNDTNEFIIQVGEEEDHNVGYRLAADDILDGKRPAMSALSVPQMGYTAAALALGAQIWKGLAAADSIAGKTAAAADKAALSAKYGAKAALIFRRAQSKDALKTSAFLLAAANPFYEDATPNDNMELAATELYRLTKEQRYFDAAKKYSGLARVAGWASWGDANIFAHLRLMEFFPVAKQDLNLDLDEFFERSKGKGNIWSLPIDYVWAGLYSYVEISSGALEYQMKTGDRKYHIMQNNLVDYLFGTNNWGISFVALKGVNSIENPFSQTYRMQCKKFPEGAISEGPGDRKSHNEQSAWFGFDKRCEKTHRFNTEAGIFYDNENDYMCMETIISGVVDGLYMITLSSKLLSLEEK